MGRASDLRAWPLNMENEEEISRKIAAQLEMRKLEAQTQTEWASFSACHGV